MNLLPGVMLLWFVLTGISVLFVALDIHNTPESPVLKLGFVLLTAYTGPVGAFLYVFGCREPLPGLHARYTAARWRQVLGSTMHCVAGDGLGILVGATIGGLVHLTKPAEIGLEYLLGFAFGWTIFQALFMKATAGGSFSRALVNTFIPEMVSMNYLMAAMVAITSIAMSRVPGSRNPLTWEFWFIMSMALLTGFIAAYPVNWWLVSNHLKHGMMTVRPDRSKNGKTSGNSKVSMQQGHAGSQPSHGASTNKHSPAGSRGRPSRGMIGLMIALSFMVLGLGLFIAAVSGGL